MRADPVEYLRSWGETDDDVRFLERDELEQRIHVHGALAGTYSPHCATVQPARLVRGLAAAVERLGVRIYEQTTATAIALHTVRTDRGTVPGPPMSCGAWRASRRASRGKRRAWLPMNSSMVVTEPLPAAGRRGDRLVLARGARGLRARLHVRPADGRRADRAGWAGPALPLPPRTDDHGRTQEATVEALTPPCCARCSRRPPGCPSPTPGAACSASRATGCTTVTYDPATGTGAAGGYVGNGLSATNLAGRTLADLVLGADTGITRLPWVNRRVRKWEPEPIRWLGVQAMYAMYRHADRREYGLRLAGDQPDRPPGRSRVRPLIDTPLRLTITTIAQKVELRSHRRRHSWKPLIYKAFA